MSDKEVVAIIYDNGKATIEAENDKPQRILKHGGQRRSKGRIVLIIAYIPDRKIFEVYSVGEGNHAEIPSSWVKKVKWFGDKEWTEWR